MFDWVRQPNFLWIQFFSDGLTKSKSVCGLSQIQFDWVQLKSFSVGFDWLCWGSFHESHLCVEKYGNNFIYPIKILHGWKKQINYNREGYSPPKITKELRRLGGHNYLPGVSYITLVRKKRKNTKTHKTQKLDGWSECEINYGGHMAILPAYYSVTNSTGTAQCFSTDHKTNSEQKNQSFLISDQSQMRDLTVKS